MVVFNKRMDLLSRERFPKEELFRLVKQKGTLVLEKETPLPGRGYYLHKDRDSLLKAKKRRALEKIAGGADCSALYEEMEAAL